MCKTRALVESSGGKKKKTKKAQTRKQKGGGQINRESTGKIRKNWTLIKGYALEGYLGVVNELKGS